MLRIINHQNGTIINGDEALLKRLPEGFDVATVDLTGVSINAHNLAIAYDYASYKGIEHIKFYAGLKEAFIEQQELAQIERDKPKESHEPAMTSQSIKPVDA